MDVIASAVEACPWGLHRFGLDGFVAENAGNSVAAVGSYWQSTVAAIQAFEERHPQVCHRVRYEDLVTAPEETAAAIFSFLGEQAAPGITEQCFDLPHEGNGSGDEKLWFTSGVSADSMGRGFMVPLTRSRNRCAGPSTKPWAGSATGRWTSTGTAPRELSIRGSRPRQLGHGRSGRGRSGRPGRAGRQR